MRTSHIKIRKRIEDEKSLITDEELFASNAFSAYLTDIAEAVSKRYRRRIRVHTYWDPENAMEAAATNDHININDLDFFKLMNRVSQYIAAWEAAVGPALKKRAELRWKKRSKPVK